LIDRYFYFYLREANISQRPLLLLASQKNTQRKSLLTSWLNTYLSVKYCTLRFGPVVGLSIVRTNTILCQNMIETKKYQKKWTIVVIFCWVDEVLQHVCHTMKVCGLFLTLLTLSPQCYLPYNTLIFIF